MNKLLRLRRGLAKWAIPVGLMLSALALAAPILSTKPSGRAADRWEKLYSSILPAGYSEFRARWQSQDVGVHIFSFRCPAATQRDQVFDHIVARLPGFRVSDKQTNEVALRRPATYSDPGGFDEFRIIYVPDAREFVAMYANLDSEFDVHDKLVAKMHDIADRP
jgi:hypothetical protein